MHTGSPPGDSPELANDGQAVEGRDNLPALAALRAELQAEAVAASASRLLVEQLSLGRVSLLLDLHVSQGSQHIPFAIDTHRWAPDNCAAASSSFPQLRSNARP